MHVPLGGLEQTRNALVSWLAIVATWTQIRGLIAKREARSKAAETIAATTLG